MRPYLHLSVPWWAKIIAKIALSRLPVPPPVWRHLNVFRLGHMRDPGSAIATFDVHWRRAGSPAPGFRYLELGPGESLATAVVAWAYGAAGGVLVDTEDFADRDIATYRRLLEALAAKRDSASLRGIATVEALLRAVNAEVVTDGATGLSRLPSGAFDFVFSHAVLEHVRLDEFAIVARELHRVQARSGVGSHRIDFKDHLQGSLNSLRISDRLWEQPWFASKSGFYTNRMRLSQVVQAFDEAGFAVTVLARDQWEQLPLPLSRLGKPFRDLSAADLLTHGADLILRRR
ncbi:MAG: methyltransferase domain-containing protein [Gemmatimonas sp.]